MKLLFLIFFSFFAYSQSHDRCLKTVENLNKEGGLGLEPIKNSYSLTLQSVLKEEIAKTKILSDKEKKAFFKELEQTIAYIENKDLAQADKSKQGARLKVLEPLLMRSVQMTPSIISFLENESSPYLNKEQALKIIFITLTKYVKIYLSHPDKESDIDFKRFEKIISTIEKFNGSSFSIYKIIRAVREKHSLYEYLNCK